MLEARIWSGKKTQLGHECEWRDGDLENMRIILQVSHPKKRRRRRREIGREGGRETDRQTDRQTDRDRKRETDRQTDRQRQRDRQTDRQRQKEREREKTNKRKEGKTQLSATEAIVSILFLPMSQFVVYNCLGLYLHVYL